MNLRIIYITIMLLGLSVSTACADYIQGHVVGIDRVQGAVEIVLCDECPGGNGCAVHSDQQAVHYDKATVVKVIAPWFPRCLTEGMMIYARGSFSGEDAGVFTAVEVFPRRMLGSEDKTGVRSRFRRHGGGRHHKEHHGQ